MGLSLSFRIPESYRPDNYRECNGIEESLRSKDSSTCSASRNDRQSLQHPPPFFEGGQCCKKVYICKQTI